jgi:carbamoyl-phosphate synthase large subunit
LVQFFKRALGGGGQVIACDSSPHAPALVEADRHFLVPPMDQPNYFDALAAISREQQVRLIFSVHDLELAGLAQRAQAFREAGTIAVVAAPHVVAACQDKWAAFRLMRANGVPTPATYLTAEDARGAVARGELAFPLLVKPRWGTSSIGVEHVENDRELELAYEWGQTRFRRTILAHLSQAEPAHSFIVQEFLDGQEYGVDVVNDLCGRYVATLARRKLVMRAGNTDRAVTVHDPRLGQLGQALGRLLAHPGVLDCDVMEAGRGYQVLDLNPRFGGGYVFSHLAGADLPAALLAWARDEEPDPAWLRDRPGVLASKYDGLMVLDGPAGDASVVRSETTGTRCGEMVSASVTV